MIEMNKSSDEKISEALDVVFEPETKIQKIENTIKEVQIKRKDQIKQDYNSARKNMKDLIGIGFDAIDGIMKVADAGDSPRAYEVASLLLKTVTEMNKDLIEIHKKAKDAEKENVTIKNTTNNSIYVGSTTDLQNLINKSRSQYKDLPEAEVIDDEDDEDGEQSI